MKKTKCKMMIKKTRRFKCKCDRSEEEEEEDGFTQRKVTTSLDDDKKLEKEVLCEGLVADNNNENSLVRTSCHDSGIDIRESMPIPTVPIIPTKKVID